MSQMYYENRYSETSKSIPALERISCKINVLSHLYHVDY